MAEANTDNEFLVRSHHLYRLLGASIAIPTESLGKSEEPILVRNFVRKNIESLMEKRADDDRQNADYAKDIVGEDAEPSDKFMRGLTEFYNEFLHLPDSHPVRIQSNMKDGICKSCALGDHCKQTIDENEYVQRFMYFAQKAGVNDLKFQHSNDHKSSIVTTVGALRKVIGYVRDTKCKNIDANDFMDLSIQWKYSN